MAAEGGDDGGLDEEELADTERVPGVNGVELMMHGRRILIGYETVESCTGIKAITIVASDRQLQSPASSQASDSPLSRNS